MLKFKRTAVGNVIGVMALSLLLSACARSASSAMTASDPRYEELVALRKLGGERTKPMPISAIRMAGLRDTAQTLGAQSGLAWRAKQINNDLLAYDYVLSRVFNFHRLLLEDNVLPPVLMEAHNALEIASLHAIRVADRMYQISSQAHFVTAAPTWRDYLWLKYAPPEEPDASLLPRNRAERILWQKYVDLGWKAGIGQAQIIFNENLARLQRDFTGMIRYLRLLEQRMVSPPFVSKLEMGVTGDPKQLNVNDRILRITALPALQTNSERWKAEGIPHE